MSRTIKLTTAAFIRKINQHKKAICKHRDAIRELVDDLENIEGSCDEAIQSLEDAADTLSQYL